MDPSTYTRIQEIVTAATGVAGDERERMLDEMCAGDGSLRAKCVEILGFADDGDGAFGDEGLESRRRELDSIFQATTDATEWHPESIGAYRVERVIGRGGMGVVFLARQASPDRVVAIKLLNPALSTQETIQRMKREAEILGSLRHPGIAQIFEAQTFDCGFGEQPYLVMEFVDGSDIVAHAERKKLSETHRIQLVISVCEAVQHAHDRGVIHRDLKPDNILVDEHGQAKLLDFGIAGVEEDAALSGLTLEGQILGTVAYMPPEQARRGIVPIGPAADVFSIGAVAFELLLGRPPRSIEGLPITDVLRELSETPAPSARSIDRSFDRDLDTILGKALETRPADRYETAAALGTDLRRYLDGRPISARPPSVLDRTRKFVRRNRVLVTAGLAVLAALLAGLIATSLQTLRAKRAEENAQFERYAAEMLIATSRADDPVIRGRSGVILDRWDPDTDLGQTVGGMTGLRWEWHLMRSIHRDDVRTLDLPSPPTDVAWHPDGDRIAVAMQDRIGVFDDSSGAMIAGLQRPPGEGPDIFFGIRWSPSGEALAASGLGGVLVWEPSSNAGDTLGSGRPPIEGRLRWFVERPFLPGVRWSRDGALVYATQDSLFAFDAATGEPRFEAGNEFHGLLCFAVDPVSGALLVTTKSGGLAAADGATGEVTRKIAHIDSLPTGTGLSPSGDAAAVVDISGRLSVYERPSGELRFTSLDHIERLFDLDWHPDGSQIATASEDGTVRTYDAQTGRRLEVFNGHTGSARRVEWSPDGKRIASTSWGGELLIWKADEASAVRNLNAPDFGVFEVNGTLSYDAGRNVLWASSRHGSVSWSAEDGRVLSKISHVGEGLIRPRGDLLVTNLTGTELLVHPSADAEAEGRRSIFGEGNWLYSAWLRGGTRIVSGNRGALFLTEIPSTLDAPLRTSKITDIDGEVLHVEASPNDDRVAILTSTGSLMFVDVESGRVEHEVPILGTEGADDIAWSADGAQVALACYDGSLRVRSAADGTLGRRFEGHAGPVLCAAWHPTGDRIATGSRDRTIKLWDPASGTLVGSLEMPATVADVLWIDEGRVLAGLDREGNVVLWDASRSLRREDSR